jgi:hypothetical protein
MPIHLGDGPQRFVFARTRVRCGGTLIRKTSLLHKIDPTALRSSAADTGTARDFHHENARGLRAAGDSRHAERLNRPPLHDVRQHARFDSRLSTGHMSRACGIMFPCERAFDVGSQSWKRRPQSDRLVEPDGIEPTTSCLQSRRSPN